MLYLIIMSYFEGLDNIKESQIQQLLILGKPYLEICGLLGVSYYSVVKENKALLINNRFVSHGSRRQIYRLLKAGKKLEQVCLITKASASTVSVIINYVDHEKEILESIIYNKKNIMMLDPRDIDIKAVKNSKIRMRFPNPNIYIDNLEEVFLDTLKDIKAKFLELTGLVVELEVNEGFIHFRLTPKDLENLKAKDKLFLESLRAEELLHLKQDSEAWEREKKNIY